MSNLQDLPIHFVFRSQKSEVCDHFMCDADPQVYPQRTSRNWPGVTCPDCIAKRPEGVQDPLKAVGWPSTPVWQCVDGDTCEAVWAAEEAPAFCPECEFVLYHSARLQGVAWTSPPPETAGFTLREAKDAENLYGCDIEIYVPKLIPFEVVKLSTIPQEFWIGMPVFHPCGQMGELANWFSYDVGIVTEVAKDPDFDDLMRCRFVLGTMGSGTFSLRYGPDNLWIPKHLAERTEGYIPPKVKEST